MNRAIASLAVLAIGATPAAVPAAADSAEKTVVLVHGAFVDGSGWAGVHRILLGKGYRVIIVQHPTTSLADDVAATRRAIAESTGEVILVGHSYGGMVITEAGTDPKVSALVYVAAFAPDGGESVASILASAPPGAPAPPILPPVEGFLSLDRTKFHMAFAADLPPETARLMADSQQPWSVGALQGTISTPAWRVRPSWYLIAQDDRMIPADAQRAMAGRAGATVRAIPGSHAVYVSNPGAVAELIEAAAAPRAATVAR